jgi:hypothetical protein
MFGLENCHPERLADPRDDDYFFFAARRLCFFSGLLGIGARRSRGTTTQPSALPLVTLTSFTAAFKLVLNSVLIGPSVDSGGSDK